MKSNLRILFAIGMAIGIAILGTGCQSADRGEADQSVKVTGSQPADDEAKVPTNADRVDDETLQYLIELDKALNSPS